MGLRRWLHKIYVRAREKLGVPKYSSGRYKHFECRVEFCDGSSMGWEGTPWGSQWERFKGIMDDKAVEAIYVNFDGDFWR